MERTSKTNHDSIVDINELLLQYWVSYFLIYQTHMVIYCKPGKTSIPEIVRYLHSSALTLYLLHSLLVYKMSQYMRTQDVEDDTNSPDSKNCHGAETHESQNTSHPKNHGASTSIRLIVRYC